MSNAFAMGENAFDFEFMRKDFFFPKTKKKEDSFHFMHQFTRILIFFCGIC